MPSVELLIGKDPGPVDAVRFRDVGPGDNAREARTFDISG